MLTYIIICFNMQLEWMTAGDCKAGMHEVVVTKSTLEAIEAAKKENRSLWRVSSTVSASIYFKHVSQNHVLKKLIVGFTLFYIF